MAEKLAAKLLPGEADDFLGALFGGRDYAPCALWTGPRVEAAFELGAKPAWAPDFVDFLAPGQRPGQSEWQEKGELYVLDPSSVAEASILQNIGGRVDSVLDVCSAPGGKGIFAWRLLSPSLLVANDALRKRLGMLAFNLDRCRVQPALMISHDPSTLKERLEGQFDLVVVDAPCSGQSMAAKGKESGGGFHPATVNQNSNRQKRILACSAACVKPGGWLAYMTCTYSPEENEEVIAWLLKRFPEFRAVELGPMAELQTHLADLPCVRVWPHRGPGAGGFSCLMQRMEGEELDLDLEWLNSVDLRQPHRSHRGNPDEDLPIGERPAAAARPSAQESEVMGSLSQMQSNAGENPAMTDRSAGMHSGARR